MKQFTKLRFIPTVEEIRYMVEATKHLSKEERITVTMITTQFA
jgi:hypothetical protein